MRPTLRSVASTLAAFALVAIGQAAAAQTIHGTLVDEGNGAPVTGGSVVLLGTNGDGVGVHAVSDEAGRFTLAADRAGEYYLEIARLGYATYRTPLLALEPTGSVTIEFALRAIPIGIRGLDVTTERAAPRMLTPIGLREEDLGNRFIDRDDIDAVLMPGLAKDIIRWQNIAGVWVQEPPSGGTDSLCVQIRGSALCALTVLNGAVVSREIAGSLDPRSLEAIAVLRPNEAATLYGTVGGAGAVLMWSREGMAGR